MRLLLPLLIIVMCASAALAQSPGHTVQSRVAAALLADIRTRMGASASVAIGNVHVTVRDEATGSLAIVPAPQARLDQPVEFVVIGAGDNGRAVQVGRGRADVYVSVPHAQVARTLVRGRVLTSDDLVEITGDPGGVPLRRLPTARELVGATLRRDAAGGEVLTLQVAVLLPAVRAGDTVQAVASIGTVQVTAELTAMDNGAEGTIVRVVNRDTHRELRARVIRAGVVEVIHE